MPSTPRRQIPDQQTCSISKDEERDAAAALASLDSDVSHQKDIIKSGCIQPLVAMIKSGSVAAQAFASQALANAAAFSPEAQNTIVKAGALPLLIALLASGKAHTPAAAALAKLARDNMAIQAEITSEGGIAPPHEPILGDRKNSAARRLTSTGSERGRAIVAV